jgi:hypothetical protein
VAVSASGAALEYVDPRLRERAVRTPAATLLSACEPAPPPAVELYGGVVCGRRERVRRGCHARPT